MRRCVPLLLGLFLLGCAISEEAVLDNWKGKSLADLDAYYGKPEQVETLPDGGQRVTYREWLGHRICDYVFTTDEQGIIQSWQTTCS